MNNLSERCVDQNTRIKQQLKSRGWWWWWCLLEAPSKPKLGVPHVVCFRQTDPLGNSKFYVTNFYAFQQFIVIIILLYITKLWDHYWKYSCFAFNTFFHYKLYYQHCNLSENRIEKWIWMWECLCIWFVSFALCDLRSSKEHLELH